MKEHEFMKAMNSINISPKAKERIVSESIKLNRRKDQYVMISKKKIMVIAAAVVMAIGITTAATSGVISSWVGGSASKPDYYQLPSAEVCMDDAGFAPVLLEQFSNGYTFDNGNVVNNTLKDDRGNKIEKFKSFSFHYLKGDDEVLFSQEKYNSEMPQSGDLISNENGVEIYYNHYTNKIVPEDYEKTQEDLLAEESGELIFSYGSSDVEISEVQGVSWRIGNMHFSLTQIDGNLSAEELAEMAREMIAQTK